MTSGHLRAVAKQHAVKHADSERTGELEALAHPHPATDALANAHQEAAEQHGTPQHPAPRKDARALAGVARLLPGKLVSLCSAQRRSVR
jgi:hypothetical protein